MTQNSKTNRISRGHNALKSGFKSVFIVFILTLIIHSCDNSLIADFEAKTDPQKPNFVELTNKSSGAYDSAIWLIRNQTINKPRKLEAYFPFKGQQEIGLIVYGKTNQDTIFKQIEITKNDPNYIDRLELVWQDDFNGEHLDKHSWTYATGDHGWGNQELQNYTNGENTTIKDGKLTIHIRKIDNKKEPGSYTSSRIHTKDKKEFQYGRYEINAKLPAGKGIWAAIWMLGSNIDSVGWPACGEMDIMEYVGFEPNTVHSTVHVPAGYAGNGDGSKIELESCEEDFHTYGMLWTPSKLIFYVDSLENVVHTYAPSPKNIENWPLNQPAFLILNVAVGGTWGGLQGVDNSIFPQTMEIDHVKVFQAPIF
ncbi:glycoside hydrolase family 16 protein [Salinivirga cyanobacteriivorans]